MSGASLKSLSKDVPGGLEALNIIRSSIHHSDREIAIVCTSLLEYSLGNLLERSFRNLSSDQRRELFEGTAPLSTFSARIAISYALAIVDKSIKSDLDLVRQIRNAFAHTIKPLNFDTPVIADCCKRLLAPEELHPPKKGNANFSHKSRFLITVEGLWFFLQGPMTGSQIRTVTRPKISPQTSDQT